MSRYKIEITSEPTGRDQRKHKLERVVEADFAPADSTQVPDDTPLTEWIKVGEA